MPSSSTFIQKLGSKLSSFKGKSTPTKKESNDSISLPIDHEDKCNKFERLFHYFDENGDGKISPIELHNRMKNSYDELSFEDLEKFMHSINLNEDGFLGYDEFVALVEDKSEDETRTSVREAFEVYKAKDVEHITDESLRKALRRLGDHRSVEECRRMICSFDVNGDGVISLDEFENMMLS